MTRSINSFRTPFPGKLWNARRRHGRARRDVRHERGFTLIELVVTISIIILLVALTVYASVALIGRSEVRRTQDTLANLDQAMKEWELASSRRVSFGTNDEPLGGEVYDINESILDNGDPSGDATRRLLQIIEKSQPVKEIIAQIDPKRLKRDPAPAPNNWLDVLDAWDKPIRAIFSGRDHLGANEFSGVELDDDGTIETVYEAEHGVALNKRLFFVSAGPDGQFGDFGADADTPEFALAGDNVYSYPPDKP